MKSQIALLTLATSALANQFAQRFANESTFTTTSITRSPITVTECSNCPNGSPTAPNPVPTAPNPVPTAPNPVPTAPNPDPTPHANISLTTYTTVTICPITSTYTSGKSTYISTGLTTSTIVVTDCHGCPKSTAVPPPVVPTTVTEVELTYTTVCPTTEVVTAPGTTYTTTRDVTSHVVTTVPVTPTVIVPGPAVTATHVEYTTITSLCPVTQVTTISGKEQTLTYTTTSLIKTEVPAPPVAPTVIVPPPVVSVVYTISAPATHVTTISGKEETVTYTTPTVVKTEVPVYPASPSVIVPGQETTQGAVESGPAATVPVVQQPTASGPVQVPTAAAYANQVPAAFVAGVFGVLVLF